MKDYTLCLGNISKDFTIDNMKKNTHTGLKGNCKIFFTMFDYQYFRYPYIYIYIHKWKNRDIK